MDGIIRSVYFAFTKEIMMAEQLDVRVQVMDKLSEMERNLRWLNKKTGIPYSTLYATFVQKVYIPSKENMDKINTVLDTDYAITA